MLHSQAPESQVEYGSSQHQYNLKTLLIFTTVTCVLLAVTAVLVPDESILVKLILFVNITIPVMIGAGIFYQSRRKPWTLPERTITVRVDAKWLRRVKSPIIFYPIAALTGVSITFAPAYLLWCGQMDEFGIKEWIGVPICLLVIYLVPGFYISLASEVIAQLVKLKESSIGSENIKSPQNL